MNMIEETIRELRSLVKKKPLKGGDLTKAKELARMLKEMGFTNKEISELTDGGWSEPTVKLYTRGVKVGDPTTKRRITELLVELVEGGLTLEGVEHALSMERSLKAIGLEVGDVLNFIGDVKRERVDMRSVIETYRGLQKAKLTIEQASSLSSYKSELDALGVSIEGLRIICELSKKYGGYNDVLKALNAYDNLQSIENKIDGLKQEIGILERRKAELNGEVSELDKKRESVREDLELYRELEGNGFTLEVLSKLKKVSEKYGGLNNLLEAIDTYSGLKDLEELVAKVRREKESVEADIKRLQTDYAHLQHVVSLCEELLYKYGMSIPAIETMYKVAKKYGGYMNVLMAIEKYGEIAAMESRVKELSAKEAELSSRVGELKNKAQEMRGMIEEMEKSVMKMLEQILKKTSESVKRIGEVSAESIRNLSSQFMRYQEELNKKYIESLDTLGNKLSDAGRTLGQLEERIRESEALSKIIDLIKRPAEVKMAISEVATLMLPYIAGLDQYVQANEENIKDAHALKSAISELCKQLLRYMRG